MTLLNLLDLLPQACQAGPGSTPSKSHRSSQVHRDSLASSLPSRVGCTTYRGQEAGQAAAGLGWTLRCRLVRPLWLPALSEEGRVFCTSCCQCSSGFHYDLPSQGLGEEPASEGWQPGQRGWGLPPPPLDTVIPHPPVH